MKYNTMCALTLGLMLSFASCEQNEGVSPNTNNAATTDLVLLATASSDVESTGTTSGTNKATCSLTEVAATDLPATVTSYISTNYSNATIEKAATTGNGNYVVHVIKEDSTHIGLLFDVSGTFVSTKGKGYGSKEVRGTEVAAAELPATITDFVSTNYAGATVLKAFKNTEGNFMVAIQKADSTVVGLAFDGNGTFTSEVTMKNKPGKGGKGKKRK